jgi:hypothetical protein
MGHTSQRFFAILSEVEQSALEFAFEDGRVAYAFGFSLTGAHVRLSHLRLRTRYRPARYGFGREDLSSASHSSAFRLLRDQMFTSDPLPVVYQYYCARARQSACAERISTRNRERERTFNSINDFVILCGI